MTGQAKRKTSSEPAEPAVKKARGHKQSVGRETNAPGGEGQSVVDSLTHNALSATLHLIVQKQRQRRLCIRSQSRCDRSVEAFIAQHLGYSNDLPEKERLAAFSRAGEIRRAIEKSGDKWNGSEGLSDTAAQDCLVIATASAAARKGWDNYRKKIEASMKKLAQELPIHSFAQSVRGFGDLGLAIIIGEVGLGFNEEGLSDFATKEKVWKYLGLAVLHGERQQKRKRSDPRWEEEKYNPPRRAEVWQIADALFRHQWTGDKDEDGKNPRKTGKPVAVPAHATGPYGAIYSKRKAHTVTRDWSNEHRDSDARRVMSKVLIEDIWKAWNGKNVRRLFVV